MKLDRNKVGLIVGVFMGLLHLTWSILVAIGLAQAFMNWIYSLHFLTNPFRITIFNPMTAIILLIVTFVFGYIFGYVFAGLWDMVQKKK